MTRKLKKSFVTITMVSAALVLAILMGIVNLANYIERAKSDTEILQYLADNGGRFPQGRADSPAASGELEDSLDSEESAGPLPEEMPLRGGKNMGRHITAETPYETRYFSVLLDAEGQLLAVDTSQIAAVSGAEAAEAAQTLRSAGRTSGRFENYRYTAVETDQGVLYIFLDCQKNIAAFRSFLLNSVIVTMAGLLVLFGVAWLLSGRAIRPVAESYEKQKSFITNAGHELKTPLAVIQSCAEVIELENGESQWTRSIHGQVERLSALTGELIALSRMDEGASQPELTELDVSEVVTRALEPFALVAEQKGLGFTADITPDIRLQSNAGALEKICAILADNAVKYASDGGEIRFFLGREGRHVILREENPAEELEAGKQEKLFDRFYRADASRSSDKPGYGLGLPLARSLAESLGGAVSAHSPDGKRLVCTVRLT